MKGFSEILNEKCNVKEPKTKIDEAKDALRVFKQDPLYNAVLTAKSRPEFDKAVKTLLSIRGNDAIKNLQAAMRGE